MRHLFWTTAELQARGFSRTTISGMVDAGRLVPLRRGLWAEPNAPEDLKRVAVLGGAATATTGGKALGIWTPDDDRLHVALPAGASRLRNPDDPSRPLEPDDLVCLHWTKRMPSPRSLPDRIAPLLLVLEHAVRCLRPELAIAMIDSALHERRMRSTELPLLASLLPAHLRAVVLAADDRADSGLESVVRYLLVQAGFAVVVHPALPGIGEVDLLVGGRLIIETDGKKHHIGDAFAKDRARDRSATLAGYRVLRLTYRQVIDEWPTTFEAICAALALA
ncbi:MAG TPA: type IV toxin-antitoxin system AbiEi family antitoxin domain-containing protein [Amnibacterium sp.]|nr:type IV toxin-antitoxin system AbiEi family antitoxin domain-containing protein [Amnibacterium sp.]